MFNGVENGGLYPEPYIISFLMKELGPLAEKELSLFMPGISTPRL
jgi:hypothetical protein